MKLMGYSQFIDTVKLAEKVSTGTIVVNLNSGTIDLMFLRMNVCLIYMDKANQSLRSMIA